ncbi:MAG: hypothetical protein KDK39_12775 [Leptospiraceae bacterium]|nr:hypothetical protein [Leptospiraceae bacterium]
MSTISQKRLIFGWLQESGWALVQLLLSPLTLFYKQRFLAGDREHTVLLLCDLMASPLAYWRIAGQLNRLGFPVWILASGSPFRGLADHARRLGRFLESEQLQKVILIGHGIGGMVALKLSDAPRQRIGHLITVGTPYNGSRLLLPLRFVPALRDMAVGSEFILFHRTNSMLYPKFTPFTAWQDELIVPFNLARYGQGRDLIVDQVGHYNLLMEKENIATIVEIIAAEYPIANTAVDMQRLEQHRGALDQPQVPVSLRTVPVRQKAASPARGQTPVAKKGKTTSTKKAGARKKKKARKSAR